MAFLRYLILAVVLFFFINRLKKFLLPRVENEGKRQQSNDSDHRTKSPHEILGVTPSVSQDELKVAYHQLISKYHPDKVNHLGEDLQAVARLKTEEINWAYDQLKS